jgi:hypothetical protein
MKNCLLCFLIINSFILFTKQILLFYMELKVEKTLSLFLWLIALHSVLVGIGLIFLPSSAFEFLGFNSTFDRFFSTQGGVFHISIAICYAMAGYDKIKYKQLIIFSIIVKFIAAIFLRIYFLLVSSQWLIIVSAVSDLLMGVIILHLYKLLTAELYFRKNMQ